MKLTYQRVAVIATLLLLITNPVSGQYILKGLNYLFDWIFQYGAYISLVAAVYLVLFFSIREYQKTRLNIPSKKDAKGKASQKYLD